MPEKFEIPKYNEELLKQAAHELLEGRAPAELEQTAQKLWGAVAPLQQPSIRQTAVTPAPAPAPAPPREIFRETREVQVERAPRALIAVASLAAAILLILGAWQVVLIREDKPPVPIDPVELDKIKTKVEESSRDLAGKVTVAKDELKESDIAAAKDVKLETKSRIDQISVEIAGIGRRIVEPKAVNLLNDEQVDRLAVLLDLAKVGDELKAAKLRYTNVHPKVRRLQAIYDDLLRRKESPSGKAPETPAPPSP
jgi:hypothetical protein